MISFYDKLLLKLMDNARLIPLPHLKVWKFISDCLKLGSYQYLKPIFKLLMNFLTTHISFLFESLKLRFKQLLHYNTDPFILYFIAIYTTPTVALPCFGIHIVAFSCSKVSDWLLTNKDLLNVVLLKSVMRLLEHLLQDRDLILLMMVVLF